MATFSAAAYKSPKLASKVFERYGFKNSEFIDINGIPNKFILMLALL